MRWTLARAKTHRDEDFPVASLLLSRPARRHVLAFYAFVRAADDIADAGDLSPTEKRRRLDAIEAGLGGEGSDALAQRLLATEEETGCGVAEARQLLQAFRADTENGRYGCWDDVLGYCALSAMPVGRFLLSLHGEGERAHAPSDALCAALQVLNHLQDCAADRAALGQIYIPEPWIDRAGGEALFFSPGEAARRRPVLDALLDRVDDLLVAAADLPDRIDDRRLAAQAGATVLVAEKLAARLRRLDPVEARVRLSPLGVSAAIAETLLRRRSRPDHLLIARKVAKVSSSFALGMRALKAERRAAILAVYAYARFVDDIADAPIPAGERLALLKVERGRLDRLYAGRPENPLERELHRAVTRFDLPKENFSQLLDGMEADASETLTLEDEAALTLYCRRVAGAVGLLSVRIFGLTGPAADRFALALGEALQLINILRDLDEDADTGRLYLPRSLIRAHGMEPAADPRVVLRHPRLPLVCEFLAARARRLLKDADEAAATLDPAKLRPAYLMKAVYCHHLDRLESRGWSNRRERPSLGATGRLRLLAGLRVA